MKNLVKIQVYNLVIWTESVLPILSPRQNLKTLLFLILKENNNFILMHKFHNNHHTNNNIIMQIISKELYNLDLTCTDAAGFKERVSVSN